MIKTKHLASLILAGAAFVLAPQLAAETPEQARIKELEAQIKALQAAQASASKTAETPAAAKPAASEYKKGLWLNFWQFKGNMLETDFPNWSEAGSVAVTKAPFSPGAIKNDPDYKDYYAKPFFFSLDGYLKITKPGAHTLTVDLEYTGSSTWIHVRKYSIYLQGDNLIRSERKSLQPAEGLRSMSTSADVDLDEGMYHIQIPVDLLDMNNDGQKAVINNYSDIKITIKLKEPGSRRARVLTENDLFYKQ